MRPERSKTTGIIGHLFQINVSEGGVPKLPIIRAEVSQLGLVGDRQAHTKFHGGVERALCLYPLEQILELQAEGHPVFPGALGENLTLAGIDWHLLAPGARISLGALVSIEITRFTTPCQSIAPYFLDGDSQRVSQEMRPGWSRVYARVLMTGSIQIGDNVKIHTEG